MFFLKKAVAGQTVKFGPFVDSTDGNTAETGLTINASDIRLSVSGGTFAAKNSGGATHAENGWYTVTFDDTDTATVGRLQVAIHVSGALPVFREFHVVEVEVYNSLFAANADIATTVADHVLKRAVSNVESTADRHSLAAVVMLSTNSAISGTDIVAKKPSDDSTFSAYPITTSASADNLTGIS